MAMDLPLTLDRRSGDEAEKHSLIDAIYSWIFDLFIFFGKRSGDETEKHPPGHVRDFNPCLLF